jgi:hypothetical protein
MDWLNENDEHSMDILRNAYDHDKRDNFPRTSDHTLFSNSVVDVFTQLNEALKLLKQMDCPNPEVQNDTNVKESSSFATRNISETTLSRKHLSCFDCIQFLIFIYFSRAFARR